MADDAPIRGDRPGSLPWSVLHERHPALVARVAAAWPYPPRIAAALAALGREVGSVIGPVPDLPLAWLDDRHRGRAWSQVPFLWAENLFYAKLLAAVEYFEGPWCGVDPFGPAKAADREGLVPAGPGSRSDLLLASVWGNRADLGFLLVAGAADAAGLVVDERPALERLLDGRPVHVVADNAGRELLPDLALIDDLLASGRAEHVVLHVKPWPYFVSDATTADVLALLPQVAPLQDALREGRFRIETHPFWFSPREFRELPGDLEFDGVTIMKGDLNYRRLVGDRLDLQDTPFAERAGHWPTPVAALRTLKSEVLCGVPGSTTAPLDREHPGWRVDGSRALIQVSGHG